VSNKCLHPKILSVKLLAGAQTAPARLSGDPNEIPQEKRTHMPRVVIFGNSGSGKSTLAAEKAELLDCAHLDLDTVAWDPEITPPTRLSLAASAKLMAPFLEDNETWVIEGCYADLLELVIPGCTEMVFLNPGMAVCAANCRNRPWEPHKYDSPEEQEANLDMLLNWVEQYTQRTDEVSLQAHRRLFDRFSGVKREYTSNKRQA